jgi:hypothetical protein
MPSRRLRFAQKLRQDQRDLQVLRRTFVHVQPIGQVRDLVQTKNCHRFHEDHGAGHELLRPPQGAGALRRASLPDSRVRASPERNPDHVAGGRGLHVRGIQASTPARVRALVASVQDESSVKFVESVAALTVSERLPIPGSCRSCQFLLTTRVSVVNFFTATQRPGDFS